MAHWEIRETMFERVLKIVLQRAFGEVSGRAPGDRFRCQYGCVQFSVLRILRSLRPHKTGIGRRHGTEYASLSSTSFRKTFGCCLSTLFYQN